ncbi:Putative monooxygenase [Pseudomonas sp. MM227]|uniref:putative quinol monooxygenase n=1 Tax=Pseudomonas sp. MM227 TaxID=3019968 RepID=UPI0022209E19|nr:putative quinol monooxygenase [Pseudomonas sp. MM227]CAI3787951.1 Putative monooxygenase [Pseudomonas sp. MM227]
MNHPEPLVAPIHIIATVNAEPGKEAELLEALTQLVRASVEESGCLQYALHIDPDLPGVFVFYEGWASQAALDEHMASPHFLSFVAASDFLITGPTDIRKLMRVI